MHYEACTFHEPAVARISHIHSSVLQHVGLTLYDQDALRENICLPVLQSEENLRNQVRTRCWFRTCRGQENHV